MYYFMSKLIAFIVTLTIIISLSSCSKDYECECMFILNDISDTTIYKYNEVKKKNAEDLCTTQESIKLKDDSTATCKIL